jgi:hypothetical protein
VSVNYATANETALADSDYTANSGTLNWADGDTASKTIDVAILNDTAAESNETFVVILSSATGGATLGTPSTATVTILDDDANPPTRIISLAGTDIVYLEDSTPRAGYTNSIGVWQWGAKDPAPVSGRLALKAAEGPGLRGYWFGDASRLLPVATGDALVAYVHLNPQKMPRMLMLQWRNGTSWEHRAYWGEDLFRFGANGPTSRVRLGDLPAAGRWVRLEVPARLVGLEGKQINGLSLNVYDGEVTWDHVGKAVPVRDVAWIEDEVPEGALTDLDWAEPWVWTNANPAPRFGTRAHTSPPGSGLQTRAVVWPPGWRINADDSLYSYVYLDPASPPKMVMLQWWDGSWEHRAYWGEDRFPAEWTLGQPTSKVRLDDLPVAGQWVRLSVPAGIVGLDDRVVTSVAFTTFDGRMVWDSIGLAVPSTDHVWVGDGLPAGANPGSYTGEAWSWSDSPTPFSGSRAHRSPPVTGYSGHFFRDATQPLQVNRGDYLMAQVYLDPSNPPRTVMLQWHDGTGWGHRAYWGENLFPYGNDGPPDRCYAGPLPPAGRWVRLEVPARLVGLEGKLVRGMSFDRYGGEMVWDHAGKSTAPLSEDVVWLQDQPPRGASTAGFNEPTWPRTSGDPSPLTGHWMHESPVTTRQLAPQGHHQHLFEGASPPFPVNRGDELFAYVYLDPTNPPQMVMLQWNDGTWEHRSYWGEDRFPAEWTGRQPTSKVRAGALPTPGQWVRLEVPAARVALEGRPVHGMAFTLYEGRAWWGHAGKQPPRKFPIVPTTDWVWVEDDVPDARSYVAEGDQWLWTTAEPGPVSGTRFHKTRWASGAARRTHYFQDARRPMAVTAGENLFCYVFLDPYALPRMIMLQWRDGTSWEHRAYWGEDRFPVEWTKGQPTSKVSMGILPPAGRWVRLEVPASKVGLAGRTVNGMAFTLAGGTASWDRAGKAPSGAVVKQLAMVDRAISWEPADILVSHPATALRTAMTTFQWPVLENGYFHAALAGEPGRSYRIEASGNLVDWVPLAKVRADAQGRFEFRDPAAGGQSARFYRVVGD